jgi:uncharacterized membrane protein
MIIKRNLLLIIIISFLGLIVSGYLSYLTIISKNTCIISNLFSCSEHLTGEYSHIFGFPFSILGLSWFAINLMIITGIYVKNISEIILRFWSIIGLITVIILVYIELFLIQSICILCTSAHICAIIIFIITLKIKSK